MLHLATLCSLGIRGDCSEVQSALLCPGPQEETHTCHSARPSLNLGSQLLLYLGELSLYEALLIEQLAGPEHLG